MLQSKRERQEASAALLLDSRGGVVAATPGAAAPAARELALVLRALRAPEPLLDEGEPGDALPVAVSIDARAPELGALLVRYDTARVVTNMVLHWPHPASTAEPVLVRRDGDFIVPVTTPLHTKAPRLPLAMDIPTTRAVRGGDWHRRMQRLPGRSRHRGPAAPTGLVMVSVGEGRSRRGICPWA